MEMHKGNCTLVILISYRILRYPLVFTGGESYGRTGDVCAGAFCKGCAW